MIRAALLAALPVPALAFTFDMPANAVLSTEARDAASSYSMPVGPWLPEGLQILTSTGEVRKQAWRIEAAGLTTLQLMTPLEQQLLDAEFDLVYACDDDLCGGFDFRFATDVLPAPDMHVDLGDYRYLAARRDRPDGAELVSILVSRSSTAGFVQIIQAGGDSDAPVADTGAEPLRALTPSLTGALAVELESLGRFVLADLSFETGSAQLGPGPFTSLQDLADYLISNPDRVVALVGHTDSVGSLDGNIALSKRRAGSVLERLVSAHGVPRRQLDAQGMGYLAPIASNLTPQGREANRRVEVIITSTE